MAQNFKIGQIFIGTYPLEAVIWCEHHNATIIQIGERKYQIVQLTPTGDAAIEEQPKKKTTKKASK